MRCGKTAYANVEQIERGHGGLNENEDDNHHHHLKKWQFGQQEVNDEVILEREHKESREAITDHR